jgi:hypothetical protein
MKANAGRAIIDKARVIEGGEDKCWGEEDKDGRE